MSLFRTVFQTVAQNRLWDFRSSLVLAVSGGRDSMVMLHILVRIAPDPASQLIIAHIDHGMRAGSADDAAFVEHEAIRYGLPFVCRRLAPLKPASGESAERAWRQRRYNALHALRVQIGATGIATAHTATDHLETVIMRLTMGAGPRGFLGIRTRRDDRVIRPLIDSTRDDIAHYAAEHAIAWRDDPSNTDLSHPRNAIRASVIPVLQSINPRVDHAAVRASRMLEREDRELSRWAERILSVAGWNRVLPAILRADVFFTEPEVIINRCATAIYTAVAPAQTGRLVTDHITRLVECVTGRRNHCPLPGGAEARYDGQRIILIPAVSPAAAARSVYPWTPGLWEIGAYDVLTQEIDAFEDPLPIITEYEIQIRTRRPRDSWRPPDSESPVSLSEHLRIRRIPAILRDHLPLAAGPDGDIRWIAEPGIPSGAYFINELGGWIKLTCRPRSAIKWIMS